MAERPFVQVKVEAPARGEQSQDAILFVPQHCECSWSHGLQPATAQIDWVSASAQASIVPSAQLTIEMAESSTAPRHTFYGLSRNVVLKIGSNGRTVVQEFVDTREYLQWDICYCRFNHRVNRMVNGVFTKYYEHLLPGNFWTNLKTWTDEPYSAAQILNFLFAAPTTETPWERDYTGNGTHINLTAPVFEVDGTGRTLGQVVLEVSEKAGTVFTLQGGRYRLVWYVKGVGTLPAFPDNADDRRSGNAVTVNPTRIRVLGDRCLYQMTNIDMVPDWAPGWDSVYDADRLMFDIFQSEYSGVAGDPTHVIGYQLAKARALTITVAEYAELRDAQHGDGNSFRDYRKYCGRSRMAMPAALYQRAILFRAFRPPSNLALRNRQRKNLGLNSLEITDRALVEVTHDAATGEMFWDEEVQTAGNGYCIVRGYQVGQDAFRTLRPENFKLAKWRELQSTWQAVQFQIDHSGEGDQFILLDQPVIQSSDLMTEVDIDGVEQSYAMLNATPTLETPAVRAALVFAAERFDYVLGIGTRDGVEQVPGLSGEYVLSRGGLPTELAYADGLTANEKAHAIALALLERNFYVASGGYTVRGCNATQLDGVLDRVTVSSDAGGMTERVDFTNERERNAFQPERDFDRRAQLESVLPGQKELREEARKFQLVAAALRQNPDFIYKTLSESFYGYMGYDRTVPVFISGGSGTLAGGTALWKTSGEELVKTAEASASLENPVFAGVTAAHNQNAVGPVRVMPEGVVTAMVQGPVEANASVGFDSTQPGVLAGGDVEPAVGTALEAIEEDAVKLILVRLGAGSGGESEPPRWQ